VRARSERGTACDAYRACITWRKEALVAAARANSSLRERVSRCKALACEKVLCAKSAAAAACCGTTTHRLMTPSPSPSARANSTCAGELSGPASAPTSLRSSADCRGNRQRISKSAREQTRVRGASWRCRRQPSNGEV
jgi:hypothetical protein